MNRARSPIDDGARRRAVAAYEAAADAWDDDANAFEKRSGRRTVEPMLLERGEQAVPAPGVGWSAVLGSGCRRTIEAPRPEERGRVRAAKGAALTGDWIRSVEADVVDALARWGRGRRAAGGKAFPSARAPASRSGPG